MKGIVNKTKENSPIPILKNIPKDIISKDIISKDIIPKDIIPKPIPPITLDEIIKIENINSNKLFKNHIEDIDTQDLNNSQLSKLEDELIRFNFNYNSIIEFVDKRIERKKSPKFYKSFKEKIINISEDKNKYEKKQLFYLLKKYYRYKVGLNLLQEVN